MTEAPTKFFHLFCPTCKKSVEWKGNPYRPFCSERCKMVDLGAWAREEYRVPVQSMDDDEDGGYPEDGQE